jgi:hypothetical protein
VRNQSIGAAVAAFALGYCSFSQAAVISVLGAGALSPAGTNVVTFDTFPQTAYGATTPAGPFTANGALFSGDGIVMRNGPAGGAGSLGLYAEPAHDQTNYLAILGGQSETLKLASLSTSFGLYWGSIDSYNSLAFYKGSVEVASFSGADITPLIPTPFGDQTSDGSNRYVSFKGLSSYDTVVLSSGQNSFELDNIATGVPELSTWAMMLIGFAGIGFAAHRAARRQDVRPTLA